MIFEAMIDGLQSLLTGQYALPTSITRDFEEICHSRWAIEELLERFLIASDRLPAYISERFTPTEEDVLMGFIDELEYCRGMSETSKNTFTVAINMMYEILHHLQNS